MNDIAVHNNYLLTIITSYAILVCIAHFVSN
jgi:hypothetical protein